ncbi:hypothetical protein L208DRAFT_1548324 [Tricholoma matsutake]|nr:hypothetical protein L208DRAFT_1548324 [Tricholoma matsutake 945]
MLGQHNMKMALPPFIPTLRSHSTGNHMRINNVFCMEGLMEAIIKCNTEDTMRPVKTDHYPIVTQLNIYAPKTTWKLRRNFRLTDWTELVKTLKDDLTDIPLPTEIDSIQEFNHRLKTLNEKIQATIEKHVKLTTLSPYSKRWWMKELADKKRKT